MHMSGPQRTYRVYCYDAEHKVVTADWLDAASDEEAISKAIAAGFGSKCELWEGKRLVAQLEDERQTG
jgi:hypothetical protein